MPANTPCRLCRRTRTLRRSHIIPEFFFEHTYAGEHRYRTVAVDDEFTMHTLEIHQKGFRERLLCDECESRLQPWEAYGAQLFYGGRTRTGILTDDGPAAYDIQVEYAPLKLLAMSILWRASVSIRWECKNVELGRKHEQRLRSMLLAADPGEADDYGFTVMQLDTEEPFTEVRRVLVLPESKKVGSEYAYRFGLAGLFWIFVVSSHRGPLKNAHQISLQRDGRFRILNGANHLDRQELRRQALLLRRDRSEIEQPNDVSDVKRDYFRRKDLAMRPGR